LRIVDVSDPDLPVEVGAYQTPSSATGVAVQGDNAYIAENNAGLRVVRVTNPSHPAGFTFHATPGSALDVVAHGEYIYVGDAGGGLSIFHYQPFRTYLPLVLRTR
jgi:hypothetical protein